MRNRNAEPLWWLLVAALAVSIVALASWLLGPEVLVAMLSGPG